MLSPVKPSVPSTTVRPLAKRQVGGAIGGWCQLPKPNQSALECRNMGPYTWQCLGEKGNMMRNKGIDFGGSNSKLRLWPAGQNSVNFNGFYHETDPPCKNHINCVLKPKQTTNLKLCNPSSTRIRWFVTWNPSLNHLDCLSRCSTLHLWSIFNLGLKV